jgi:type IV secretory pathway TraG/TraD family ATPase VirD4
VGLTLAPKLPRFHPATRIRSLGQGEPDFTIADATCHVAAVGATGSGKSSGTGMWGAVGYMGSEAQMGMLFLCSKTTDPGQYTEWTKEVGRGKDVRRFDASGDLYRFNFLDWLSSFAGEGAGLTINVVAFLEEIIMALNPERTAGTGENIFWEDELHHLLVAAVMLVQLAGFELSLPTLRDIVRSAPLSREEAKDPRWQGESACWFFLEKARERCAGLDAETQADYAECRAYFLTDWSGLSEKTRSIITLMFTKLAQPFSTRPLRRLFCSDTTLRPEDTFDGAVIIVALPTMEYRLVGVIAALVWKYAWQLAVLRRKPAPQGQYLRPVCCFADEAAENFLSRGDLPFAAQARQTAGCLFYLAQNVSQYRKRLGGDDAFEACISNFQTLVVHQSTGPTCRWMAERLGEQWERVPGISRHAPDAPELQGSSGISIGEQRRYLVEPSVFTTLARGGAAYGYEVEAILYKGGQLFASGLPYKRMRFRQSVNGK